MPLPYSTPTVALPEGWYSERFSAPPVPKTGSKDKESAPTALAVLDFTDGWRSDRAVQSLPVTGKYRDDAASTTILSVQPLASAFKEGWYSERYCQRPLSFTKVNDQQSCLTILLVPPLASAFKEGWYSERFLAYPASRTIWKNEPAAAALLLLPPLAPAFKEGWSDYKSVSLTRRARPATDLQTLDFFSVSGAEGWQVADRKTSIALSFGRSLVRDEWQSLGLTATVVTAAPQGWQAVDRESKTLYYSRPLFKDEWQSFSLTATVVPTTTPYWQSERYLPVAVMAGKATPSDAEVRAATVQSQGWQVEVNATIGQMRSVSKREDGLTPVNVFQAQGWQAESRLIAKQTCPSSKRGLESQTETVVAIVPQGWWTEAKSSKPSNQRWRALDCALDLPLVKVRFVEGWQSDRFVLHPQQVRREDRYDWQQLFVLPITAAPIVGSIIWSGTTNQTLIWTGPSNVDIVWNGVSNVQIVWTGRTA